MPVQQRFKKIAGVIIIRYSDIGDMSITENFSHGQRGRGTVQCVVATPIRHVVIRHRHRWQTDPRPSQFSSQCLQ